MLKMLVPLKFFDELLKALKIPATMLLIVNVVVAAAGEFP